MGPLADFSTLAAPQATHLLSCPALSPTRLWLRSTSTAITPQPRRTRMMCTFCQRSRTTTLALAKRDLSRVTTTGTNLSILFDELCQQAAWISLDPCFYAHSQGRSALPQS